MIADKRVQIWTFRQGGAASVELHLLDDWSDVVPRAPGPGYLAQVSVRAALQVRIVSQRRNCRMRMHLGSGLSSA
ncbi:MAG: hypothetical protein AAF494_10390 [Pseudomonadota bacterium]